MKSSWRVCLYMLGSCLIVAAVLSSYMKYPGSFKFVYSMSTIDDFNLNPTSTESDNWSAGLLQFISTRKAIVNAETTFTTSETTLIIQTTTYQTSSTSRSKTTTTYQTTSTSTSKPSKTKDNNYFLYTGILPPNVTVVTAYFNLGSFRKGGSNTFDTKLYMKWATVYTYIRNPLVIYTDSKDIADEINQWRQGFENITKIVVVERKAVWAFDYIDRIAKIYADPKYPKHHPNTVVPGYTCAQHAKYALVEDCIKKNYFNTPYYTWIDLGYFRDVVGRKKEFVIQKPPNFNESRVAMNKVYNVDMKTPVPSIFRGNQVWIGGGMFFGNKKTLPLFIEDYRLAIERYLSMNLSSTDQQIIFSMNTDSEKDKVRSRVPLQQYFYGGAWFGLGFDCYRELVP